MTETLAAPAAPGISGLSGAPEAPGVSGVSGVPGVPGVPGATGVSVAPEVPGVPGAPEAPEAPARVRAETSGAPSAARGSTGAEEANPYARPAAPVAGPADRLGFWIGLLPVAIAALVAVPLAILAFWTIRGFGVPEFLASPTFLGGLVVASVAAAAGVRILGLARWARYALAPLVAAGLLVVFTILGDIVL